MNLAQLQITIERLLDTNQGRPVIVFAALWPFLRSLDMKKTEIPKAILQLLQDIVGKQRNLLMPTFTKGFKDGLCDLDHEPSTTGMLSEMFRQLPNAERNLSAFFSYAILGPDAEEFSNLKPEFAWGDDSPYHWMEQNNASFLMLGTHPTHCSYLHRMEWLVRDQITYRYIKNFDGRIIRRGKTFEITEKLYVRSLNPELVNDFTNIYSHLCDNGMDVVRLDGIHVSHMTATKMRDTFLPLLQKDPLITVKNRQDFEAQ